MGPHQGQGYSGSRPEKEAPNSRFVDLFVSSVCLDLIASSHKAGAIKQIDISFLPTFSN